MVFMAQILNRRWNKGIERWDGSIGIKTLELAILTIKYSGEMLVIRPLNTLHCHFLCFVNIRAAMSRFQK